MGVIFALLAAFAYGSADFFGGLATKKSSVLTVVTTASALGLGIALVAVPLFSPHPPTTRDIELGALIGLVSGGALASLYRGLAVARMSVVAPITAVVAAIVPVAFGRIVGERPSWVVATGIVLAIGAVGLISLSSHEDIGGQPEPKRSGIPEALLAGVGFGLVYVILSQTSRGMWPLVSARVASLTIVGGLALATRRLEAPTRQTIPAAFSGTLDMVGNIFYLTALRHTLISVAAVLASLYPASTVMLARIVLKERLGRVQWIGIACAAAGIALIAHG